MISVISIIMMIVGAVIAAVFSKVAVAAAVGLGLTMFGAGIYCSKYLKDNKGKGKDWLLYLSTALIAVGCFVAGFIGQISEDQVTMLITDAVAIAMVIAGILVPVIKNAIENKKSKK